MSNLVLMLCMEDTLVYIPYVSSFISSRCFLNSWNMLWWDSCLGFGGHWQLCNWCFKLSCSLSHAWNIVFSPVFLLAPSFSPNSLLFLLDIMSSFRMIKDLGKAFMPSTMSFYSYFACDGNSTCMLYPLSIKLMYPYLAESSLSEASEVHFKWKT